MNWNKWVRQSHRWISIIFTVTIIINVVAVFMGKYARWVGLLAVPPILLLLFSGLYLFMLPYMSRWRSGRRTS